MSSDKLDAKLVRCTVLAEATPGGLAAFAQQGKEQESLVEKLLADDAIYKEDRQEFRATALQYRTELAVALLLVFGVLVAQFRRYSSALIILSAAPLSLVGAFGLLIITGTPAGIGPMQPGDVVEVRIEGIGSLKNTVIAG